jgi:hypothetical protein
MGPQACPAEPFKEPPLLNCTYPSLTRAVPPVAQLHVSISHARIQYSYAHLHTSIALFPTIAVRGSSHLLLLLLDGGHAELLARKRFHRLRVLRAHKVSLATAPPTPTSLIERTAVEGGGRGGRVCARGRGLPTHEGGAGGPGGAGARDVHLEFMFSSCSVHHPSAHAEHPRVHSCSVQFSSCSVQSEKR